jgi:hypothetical protein
VPIGVVGETVADVPEPIAIAISLVGIGVVRAIVADVPDPIVVAISLVGVIVVRAVIASVDVTIVITIGEKHQLHARNISGNVLPKRVYKTDLKRVSITRTRVRGNLPCRFERAASLKWIKIAKRNK